MKQLSYFPMVIWFFCSNFVISIFLNRSLLLFLLCICVSVHTIPCSRLECWHFTILLQDKQVQSVCLWFARMCIFFLLIFLHLLTCSITQNMDFSFVNFWYIFILIFLRMVARYAPPISYNFLNLIHLDKDAKTIFEKVSGFLLSFYLWAPFMADNCQYRQLFLLDTLVTPCPISEIHGDSNYSHIYGLCKEVVFLGGQL